MKKKKMLSKKNWTTYVSLLLGAMIFINNATITIANPKSEDITKSSNDKSIGFAKQDYLSSDIEKIIDGYAINFENIEETTGYKITDFNKPIENNNKEDVVLDSHIDDINYLAKCVLAESGNQDEYGMRLVIDVILNRADKYDCSTTDVINAPNQFDVVANNSINNMEINDEICTWIQEESLNRTNSEVFYFCAWGYFSWATPLFQHEDHYFCK